MSVRQKLSIGVAVLLMMALLSTGPRGASAQCCGDCNNDGSVTVDEIVTGVTSALGGCPLCVRTAEILSTGQTKCWDSSGAEIACAGSGQDGEQQRGAPRSYTNNGDGTITDNATSLMWEVKSDDESVHDKDNRYTWEAALAFVRGLNQAAFAGHNDWRLPNVFEIESITDFDRFNPAGNPVFNTICSIGCTVNNCSCTDPSTFYWSSSASAREPNRAWVVDATVGGASRLFKSSTFAARAVRSTVLPGCALGVAACMLPPQ